MSHYQKHPENATFAPVSQAAALALAKAVALLVLGWMAIGARPVAAAPAGQGAAPGFPNLYLTPAGPVDAVLHMHAADIAIAPGAAGPEMQVEALYRLENKSNGSLAVPLRITTPAGAGQAALLGESVGVSVGGQEVGLTAADGGYSGQVTLAAEGRADVRLRYRVALGEGPVAAVEYSAQPLTAWRNEGTVSLRVTLAVAAAIPLESWLRIAPDDWSYGAPTAAGDPTLKWLSDGGLPSAPFVFEFIHPAAWQQVQNARQAAADGAPGTAAALGDLYRSLYRAASGAGASAAYAERFYGQALAAYAEGLAVGEAAGRTPAELAPLHAGMAALYRSRIVSADGVVATGYAELTAEAAAAALEGLAADDGRAVEMGQWEVEALKLLMAEARSERDWSGALAQVERMARLPESVMSAEQVEAERRALLVQQALALLEEGNRAAAVALAGPEIIAPQFAPPANTVSLFAGWQITATAGTGDSELEIVGLAAAGQEEAAAQALGRQVEAWRRAASGQVMRSELEPGGELRVELRLPAGQSGLALAEALEQEPEWALLRALLLQAGPVVERKSRLLWQRTAVRQGLDLRTARDQWEAMAANLERQAEQYEAESRLGSPDDAAAAERSLQARVQAANYREAAQAWRGLSASSYVVLELRLPSGLGEESHSWLVTPKMPAQEYEFQTQSMAGGRLLAALAAAAVGLVLVSGLLWRLL